MNENTIFQNTEDQTQTVFPQQPSPQVSILEEETQPQETKETILNQSPPASRPPWLPFKTIIKAVLGIIVVLLIGFVLLYFVIPRFGQKQNEKVTLIYWGVWEDKPTMQAIISDFTRENPNIEVTYIKQDIKEYRERLTTRIQNGTGPDIFRFHNTWLLQLSSVLLPLSSDVIKKEDFQKWFYPVSQNDLTLNGAIYGIPLGIDTLALFVNSEIFEVASASAPTNWDDFIKTARLLTVKDENGKIKTAGAALGTFDNITHAPDIISLLLIQNGADLKNLTATSQKASEALDFYTLFAKGEGNVWDETLDPSLLAFSKGNLAMYFGYSWDIFTIKAMNPKLIFQIHPVPHLPKRSMTIASYWVEGASVKSKHQKEALLFLKFLANKETEEKLFLEQSKTRLFGEPYARKDLAETLKDNSLVYPFVLQAKDSVSSFFASDTFDNGLNSQMNGYLGNAVRSILGNTSPQSAVNTLSAGVSQVLKQYGQ